MTFIGTACRVALCVMLTGCGRQRMADVETRNRQLQDHVARLSGEADEAAARLEESEATWRSRLVAAQEERTALQADADRLEDQLRDANGARQQVAQDHQALAVRLAATRDELQRVTALLQESRAQRDRAQARRDALEQTVAEYRAQLEAYAAYLNTRPADDALPAAAPRTPSHAERVGEMLTPAPERPLSRRDFAAIVQGMTERQVRTYLGEPDRVEGPSPRRLVYTHPSTYAMRPDSRDEWVEVQIDDGVATFCYFP